MYAKIDISRGHMPRDLKVFVIFLIFARVSGGTGPATRFRGEGGGTGAGGDCGGIAAAGRFPFTDVRAWTGIRKGRGGRKVKPRTLLRRCSFWPPTARRYYNFRFRVCRVRSFRKQRYANGPKNVALTSAATT